MKELHLFDLPNELRIKLKIKYRKKLFDLAYKKFKTTAKIAKLMKLEPLKIRLLRNGRVNPTIDDLKTLLSILTIFSFDELEENVRSIRSKKGYINNPKLPFKLSSNIGTIIGGVLGDGGITGKFCKIFYSNTNEKLVNTFINCVKSIFGDIKYRVIKKEGVNIVEMTNVVGKILLKNFNLPRGDKTLVNYELPVLLFNTNDKNLVRSFLRRIFDDEGCVHKNGNITFSTSIEKSTLKGKYPRRLLGIIELLRKFDVKSGNPIKINERLRVARGNPNSKATVVEDWVFLIYHKKYLRNFQENIGFEMESKNNNLRKVINSIEREETPHKEGLMYFLQNSRELFAETNMPFSRKDLEIKTNRKRSITGSAMKKLKELNLLREMNKNLSINERFLSRHYIVTKEGLETKEIDDTIK